MTEEITVSALSMLEEKGLNKRPKNLDRAIFFARQIHHNSKIISEDGQGTEKNELKAYWEL